MQRKPYFVPISMFVLAAVALMNVAERAVFQTYKTVDVLSLFAAGMLFGVGWMSTMSLFRRARVR